MKRLRWLLLALLGLCVVPSARAQIGSRSFTTTVVANDVGVGNIGSGIAYHQISWNPVGTVTTCDARLQGSADNVTYSDIISNQVCTSAGASAVVNTSVNYIKIEVTTLSGGGSVTVHWNGWNASPSGGGSIAGCTTTGGVAYENGTSNTLTCGAVLTFVSGTLTNSFSDAVASASTTHFGDPDSSIPAMTSFTGNYPARNEMTAVGGSNFLNTLTVTGYNNAPDANFASVLYNSTSSTFGPVGMLSQVFDDGITSAQPLTGHEDNSQALNGTNLTGDGIVSGFVSSFTAEPNVTNIKTDITSGAASHADFEYGFWANTYVGNMAAGDTSTVTNLEPFAATPLLFSSIVVTNLRDFHARAATKSGSPTVTNQYGFYADAMTTGVNNWGYFDALTNKERFGLFSAVTYSTQTACAGIGTAANPSVASCTAAAAGLFSCATNASTGTCQVNTTAVTANSVIQIISNAADGTPLGVTCNTTNTLPTTKPLLASKSAGVSFTINLGTVTANPACFEYVIFN